jgi:flagellar hook-associated protein 3 FlgL
MIGNLSGSAELFLANLQRTRQDLERAQNQLSSGRRVDSVADAPGEITPILQLRAGISWASAATSALGTVKALVDTAEQAVQTAVKLMDRAAVLAAQAGSPLQDASSRQGIMQEVDSLLEQMVALAVTDVAGRYVFSGDSDRGPCYRMDLPGGVVRLTTPSNSLIIADPEGSPFSFSRTAQEIFDSRNSDDTPAENNVFKALNELRAALAENDDARLEAVIPMLRRAGAHLNSQLAFYGAVQSRIDRTLDLSQRFQIEQQRELGRHEDADLAALALQISQGQVQQEASLASRAKLPRTSLFDYLG